MNYLEEQEYTKRFDFGAVEAAFEICKALYLAIDLTGFYS